MDLLTSASQTVANPPKFSQQLLIIAAMSAKTNKAHLLLRSWETQNTLQLCLLKFNNVLSTMCFTRDFKTLCKFATLQLYMSAEILQYTLLLTSKYFNKSRIGNYNNKIQNTQTKFATNKNTTATHFDSLASAFIFMGGRG
jgi:hypothetical protein